MGPFDRESCDYFDTLTNKIVGERKKVENREYALHIAQKFFSEPEVFKPESSVPRSQVFSLILKLLRSISGLKLGHIT